MMKREMKLILIPLLTKRIVDVDVRIRWSTDNVIKVIKQRVNIRVMVQLRLG